MADEAGRFWSRIRSSNYAQSLALRGLNGILLLGISVLLARLLGPAEYGRYAILLGFATLFAIPFTAGLPHILVRDVAAARIANDPGRVHQLIQYATRTFIILVPVVVLLGLLFALIGWEIAGMVWGGLIACAVAPLLGADANRMGVMRGLGSAVRSQLPDMLIRPVGTLVLVVGLLTVVGTASALEGLAAYAGATLIGFAVGGFMVQRALRGFPRVNAIDDVKPRRFLSSVLTLSLLGGAKASTASLDMVLVNGLLTHDQAGHYKVALTGLAFVLIGSQAVVAVLHTRMSSLVGADNRQLLLRAADRGLFLSVAITAFLTVIVVVAGRPTIFLIFGADYIGAWWILVILSCGHLVSYLMGFGDNLAMLMGYELAGSVAIVVGVGVTVAVSMASASALGPIGIAIGSSAGVVVRQLLLAVLIRRRLSFDITVMGAVRRALGRIRER